MPIRGLSLDLFDTVVDMHMDRLPLVDIDGRRVPSTYGLLHAASVQWHGLEFERFATELARVDREMRETYYAEHRELPTIVRFRAFGALLGVSDDAMARTLTDVHMGAIRERVTVPGHHDALLGRLRARVPVALCSNFSHSETAREVLDRAGLLDHFDVVVISDALGLRKPRAEIFRAVAERLRLPPAEILHVGDSLDADVAGAKALGMRTAWLTRRVRKPEDVRGAYTGAPPDHVIADLEELEPLLDT